MKKTIYLVLIMMCAWACNDNLNIDPPSGLPPETVLSDGDNLRNLLLGAYRFIGLELQGELPVATELLANDGELLYLGTFFQFSQFDSKQVLPTNGSVLFYWANLYRSINLCNIVLDNLDLIDDASTRALIEGEAKFLRGLSYFELVRIFALPYEAGTDNNQLGLPLVFEGVVDASQISFPARQSVEDVSKNIDIDRIIECICK